MEHLTTLTVPPLGNLNQEAWDWLVAYRYADWTSAKAKQDAFEAERLLQNAQSEQRQARRNAVVAQVKAMHEITDKARWSGTDDPRPFPADEALEAARAVQRTLDRDANLQAVYDEFYAQPDGSDWTEAQLEEQERALNHLLNQEGLLPFVATEVETEAEALNRLSMRFDDLPRPPLSYDPDDAFDDQLASGYLPWEDPDVPDEREMPEDMAQYYYLSDKCSEPQKAYLDAVERGQVTVPTQD